MLLSRLKKNIGQQYEDLALAFLQQNGATLLQRNYQTRYGEIDLIMQDQQHCLLFVEVRFRSSKSFGGAISSVDKKKQHKLIKTANHFISSQLIDQAMRFDVIAISPAANKQHEIQWLKNAFDEF